MKRYSHSFIIREVKITVIKVVLQLGDVTSDNIKSGRRQKETETFLF